jgi:hypothetical protein
MRNVPSVTTASQIGVAWDAPTFDGGSPVLDYRVWSDKGTIVSFYDLADGLTVLEYIMADAVQGTQYQFFVQARNAYGYSVFSNFALIKAG